MRVLTVANHLGSRGGLERTQMTNCRALAERGHTLDVLYVSAGDFEAQWRAFADTMLVMPASLPRRHAPVSSTLGVAKAIATAARRAPDVLYVYRYWDLPLAAAVGRLTGAAVVLHLCLLPPTRVAAWLRWALRHVDRTLSVSVDTAGRWTGTGLDPSRVDIALTGIDLEQYRPATAPERAAARRADGLAEDAPLVGYFGRIGREKGVDVLLRAFAELAAAQPDAQLVVVGSPSLGADPLDSERYRRQLDELAHGRSVWMLPGRTDVVPLLQSVDVAVVPSLWAEPLSRAVMEPLACGVPVVATDVGGNGELLTGWLRQFLEPPGDASALAGRLRALVRWRSDDTELGERCRRHAEEAFDLQREADIVERVLQEAVAGSRRARRRAKSSPIERTSCG